MDGTKTRKPHRKSRNGCFPCKARHVKCDEQKPACINCDDYGSKCEYPRPKRAVRSDAALSPICLGTPSSTQSQTPDLSSANAVANEDRGLVLDIMHLRLVHHFTTVTAKTLAHEPGAEEVLSSYLVKLAFDNHFLLHAILALAAFHLSRLEPHSQAEYLLQAEQNHQTALTQFRVQIKEVDESNSQSVLSFNYLLFPYSWAIATSSNDLGHTFDSIVSNLVLTWRAGLLVQTSGLYEKMKQSTLGQIIPSDIQAVNWRTAEPPEQTELVQLRKFSQIIHHIYPSDIIDAYKQSIHNLEILFDAISKLSRPASDSLLKSWIHTSSPRFIELLTEKQPGALIIFAHYGVLLGRSSHYWFLEGVDEVILTIADHFVPAEWKGWLDWPKEQIRAGLRPSIETR